MNISEKKEWMEVAFCTAFALAALHVNILFFLFLIPLQVLFIRRGMGKFLISSAVVMAGIGISALIKTVPIEDRDLRFIFITLELAFPLLLLIGLFIVNSSISGFRFRIYRALTAAAVTGLISVPIIYFMSGNEKLVLLLKEQIVLIAEMLKTGLTGGESFESSVLAGILKPDQLAEMIRGMIFKNYLFFIYIIITGSWWLGTVLHRRIIKAGPYRIEKFTLPEILIWPLLTAWAGILFDTIFGLGIFGYIFWNAGLIMLFTYGLQGFGIIQFFFTKRGFTRGSRFLAGLFLAAVLFWPGINLIIIIGIPGLGLSELWIKYRQVKEES